MDPFIGEIKILSFDFVPYGWAACDGQVMQIVQNQALYTLLGTQFGGDARTTFCLPDLRGRVPLHEGITGHPSIGGEAAHPLSATEVPVHTHPVTASDSDPDAPYPTGNTWPAVTKGYASTPDTTMVSAALGSTGISQPHENRQPYLVMNFVIALIGIYPSRS